MQWGVAARDLVLTRLGVVPGRILHLWHGDLVDRRYSSIEREFRQLGFDPAAHLQKDENGLWEWSEQAPPRLKTWADRLFHGRNEDGDKWVAPSAQTPPARAAAAG